MPELKEQECLPDWDTMADKFSVWLPYLAPANEKILTAIDALMEKKPIRFVLDIATGTGEPALSIAQHYNDTEVLAVDVAEGMVRVAKQRAQALQQNNMLSAVSSAESIAVVDEVFDVCTSRFGVMLLDDINQGLNEIYRILKKGGHFIATVWSDAERMPTLQWAYQVFRGEIPNHALPPLKRATCLGDKTLLGEMLIQAGFQHVQINEHELCYRFDSFDDYWVCIEESGIMQPQLRHLPTHQHTKIKTNLAMMAESFMTAEGLIIPHRYHCFQAQK